MAYCLQISLLALCTETGVEGCSSGWVGGAEAFGKRGTISFLRNVQNCFQDLSVSV